MNGFKQFILRGNVIDLAVGVVIGAAFTSLVNSMVKDILTPVIGVVAQIPDLSGIAFTLRGSTFMFGSFLNAVISFTIIAATIYFAVVLPMNTLLARAKKDTSPTTKKCGECLSDVPLAAKRCAHCTSVLA